MVIGRHLLASVLECYKLYKAVKADCMDKRLTLPSGHVDK